MRVKKSLFWILVLALVVCGCTREEPSFDTEQYPTEEVEYVRLNLESGCGYSAATDDVEATRVVWEDVSGSGSLPLVWERVDASSEKTGTLSLILSDGEKPILGRLLPTDATDEESYSGLSVTPQEGDAHHADLQTNLYYNSEHLKSAAYCCVMAGGAPVVEDATNGIHLRHLQMPSMFTQTESRNANFLRSYMYMYATTPYKESGMTLNFKHIPATFRFVITNSTNRDIALQNVTISTDSDGVVASKNSRLKFDWASGDVEVLFGESGHSKIGVNIDSESSLASGEKYIAYAMALPMPSDESFKGKTLKFSVKSDDLEQVAFELDGERLAELNSSNIYNWVSGKSYTVKITIREDSKATGEILDGNRIEVTPATSGIYTLVYEGEDGLPLDDYAEICTLTIKELAYYEDFIDVNVAPREAKNIGIYDSMGKRQGTIYIPDFKPDYTETPIYRFGVLSDVHIGRAEINPEVDFERALKFFNSQGVVQTCICGDLTQNGKEAELTSFRDVASLSDAPIYATTGNHDATTKGIAPELWEKYIGLPLVYEREVVANGKVDHFLFLGMERWKFSAAYLDYHLVWLESKLEEYRNDRCFIFTHLFFPDRAGNMNGVYPSGNWLSGEQLERLQAMCDRYRNSIWFSGHSHWEWCLQKYQDRANIYRGTTGMTPTSGWCVHIPSCGVPRTSDGSSRSDVKAGSEGALVEVYKDHIDILGIEFISGKYLPIATYRLDTTPQTIAADNVQRANYYISASDFVVNPSKNGATVKDVEGMPNYVEVTFTDKGQGFYVANSSYTTSATMVSITVEDVAAWSNGEAIDVPANVGFYGGSYYMTSTQSAQVVSGTDYWGVQFQTSKSKYGDAPLPLTLRMKVQMAFTE